jgi:hypothetical protein
MSLDYPFYQELQRRKHPAAKWWRVGDALYYLGLLPVLLLAIPAIIALIEIPFGVFTKWQGLILMFFVVFVAIFFVGTRLKRKAWAMAARDGINVNDF